VTNSPDTATEPQSDHALSDRTAKRLRDAMDRLLAGCPQRTDGRLIKDNLWKEADVSRATMNRATQIMADWDTRVAACDSFTPREARKNDELTSYEPTSPPKPENAPSWHSNSMPRPP
jgi:hypothetical protein